MASSSVLRTVLVAVDASENAKAALNYYLDEVHRKTDMLIICHIPDVAELPAFTFKLSFPAEEWQKAIQEQLQKVKQVEETFEQIVAPRKIQYKLRSEQSKTPGQGIIAVAEAEKAQLIVIGTRGLDILRRTLLGSVSDYVTRHSKVPVLVCPYTPA